MSRRLTWGLALSTATLFGACAVENPPYLRDTTGAELLWECDTGNCRPVRGSFSPLPPECADDTELLVGAGPIAILCGVSRGPDGEDIVHDETCRPLACVDDLSCPQWNAREYICLNEFCQVADASTWRLDRTDMSALCLFDVERHASCDEALGDPIVQARLSAVDEACPMGVCERVPEGCLAP